MFNARLASERTVQFNNTLVLRTCTRARCVHCNGFNLAPALHAERFVTNSGLHETGNFTGSIPSSSVGFTSVSPHVINSNRYNFLRDTITSCSKRGLLLEVLSDVYCTCSLYARLTLSAPSRYTRRLNFIQNASTRCLSTDKGARVSIAVMIPSIIGIS